MGWPRLNWSRVAGNVSRPSQVVVLAEDQRHQRFVRRLLYRKGFKPHQIRMEPLPSGRGCGEQWVRDRYTASVHAYRARSAKAESGLIIVIDADTGLVDKRRRQFQNALSLHGLEDRRNDEAIAHLIPKRQIETWILHLTGTPVDEDTDYHNSPEVDRETGSAADAFFNLITMTTIPTSTLESVVLAISEAKRLG